MTTLGPICSFLNGGTPSRGVARYYQGDVPWITGADISGPRADTARSFITEEAIRESATNRVPAGTVLLVTRTSVGKVALAAIELCFSQDITAITPDPHCLDRSYLVHFLRTKQPHLERRARGATIKGVTREAVANLAIPLPPLAEQKRIAGILDAADALRAKRREALGQLDTLLQSTFLDMFGDPVTNPMGWEVRELGEVAGFHAGSTLPAGEDFVGQDGGFLYLKVGDLNHILNKEAVVRSNIWGKEAKKGITAPKDAVVIPKRGGAIGTNKKRLLSRKSVLDPNLMAISGSESLHHVYLHRWFHTFDLMSITSGSTVPQLNKRDLAPLRIPLPPVDLQHRFAAVVESVERQRASQRAHLAELDTLFASLQSHAFRGDL